MAWDGAQMIAAQREAAPVRVTMVGPPDIGFATSVTPISALSLSAVWRCIDIISNGVAQLPWREMRGTLELPPSRIVVRPQADRTRREWVQLVVSTLALFDVAHVLKTGGTDSEGVPLGLWPVDPRQVMPVAIDPFSFILPQEYFVGHSVFGREDLVIIHRGPQPTVLDTMGGVLQLARASFAAALAADQYASRYWQAGGNPVVALETEQHLNQTEATEVQDRWAERRSKGPDYAPVLSGGIKAHPFGADPTTESAVEARREMVADIARYFGVPTYMINAPTGDSQTYKTAADSDIQLLRFTLSNYISAIQDAITDLLPGGRRMEMDTSTLTMGNQFERAQSWNLALTAGWMSKDEVREFEGLPPQEAPMSPEEMQEQMGTAPTIPPIMAVAPGAQMWPASAGGNSNAPR